MNLHSPYILGMGEEGRNGISQKKKCVNSCLLFYIIKDYSLINFPILKHTNLALLRVNTLIKFS